MKKIKALLISPSLYWGGAEQWMHDLIHHSQYTIDWVGVVPFCNYNNDPHMVRLIGEHCPVYFFGFDGINRGLAEDPDIIVSWGDPDLSRIDRNIPIVWCAHGSGGFDRYSYSVCRKWATHFAAVSKACLTVFNYEDREKVEILYNGVDPERVEVTEPANVIRGRLGISPGTVVVGYHGRVVLEKNLLCLAKAVAQLPNYFTLCLVGGGCSFEQCKWEIKQVLGERAVFTDRVLDIGNYLQIFDYFVLPSLNEGFSLSLLEATLCKIPCLITSVGSLPELMEKYGMLWWSLSSTPTPGEIAQSLLALHRTPKNLMKSRINAAYSLVMSEFQAFHMAERWIKYLYRIQESYNVREENQPAYQNN